MAQQPTNIIPSSQLTGNLVTFLRFVEAVTRIKQPAIYQKLFGPSGCIIAAGQSSVDIVRILRQELGPKNFEILRSEFVKRLLQQHQNQFGKHGSMLV